MTRLALAACLAALAASASAQKPAEGAAAAAKDSAEAAKYDLRVKFDADSAKGEVTCKEGKLGGKDSAAVEYKKCLHDKLDKYDSVAIAKKIVASKEKYDALDAKKKRLAKKLAFLHSAHGALKGKLAELGEAKKEDVEYKKAAGALKKIDKDFDKSIEECGKEDKAVFTCPSKD